MEVLNDCVCLSVQLSSRCLVLDVGEDRLMLTARPSLFHLDIFHPFLIDQENSVAQFNKSTQVQNTHIHEFTAKIHTWYKNTEAWKHYTTKEGEINTVTLIVRHRKTSTHTYTHNTKSRVEPTFCKYHHQKLALGIAKTTHATDVFNKHIHKQNTQHVHTCSMSLTVLYTLLLFFHRS